MFIKRGIILQNYKIEIVYYLLLESTKLRDQKKETAIEIDQNRLLILFEGLVVPLPPPLFKKVGANEEREEREKFGERGASDILKSHVQFYG